MKRNDVSALSAVSVIFSHVCTAVFNFSGTVLNASRVFFLSISEGEGLIQSGNV